MSTTSFSVIPWYKLKRKKVYNIVIANYKWFSLPLSFIFKGQMKLVSDTRVSISLHLPHSLHAYSIF